MFDANLRPLPQPGVGGTVTYGHVRPVRHRVVKLTVRFPSGYCYEVQTEDFAADPRVPFTVPSQLPEPIKNHLYRLRMENGSPTPVTTSGDGTSR